MSIAPELDVTTANMARVYDYWRGGRESFNVDRQQAAAIEALYPLGRGPVKMVAANRAWLGRAVSSAVHDRVYQVIDCGSGFADPDPLHVTAKAARKSAPASVRVCYVDRDPVVVSHGRAVTKASGVAFAEADLTRPGEVMGNPDFRSVIDPGRPCLVLFGLVLHFTGAVDARRIIEGWASWLPARSRIAVTVAHWPDEGLWERIRAVYGPGPLYNHSGIQVAGMMRGLDLLGNGVEAARAWGPEAVDTSGPGYVLAAIGRKS